MNPRWQDRTILGRDSAGTGELLVVKIGEIGAPRVVARRRHIGEVVGDNINLHLLRCHSAGRNL